MTVKNLMWVALIRGIGASTHKKMSMQQLRDSCTNAKLDNVKTLLATGNLLFTSKLSKPVLQQTLMEINQSFGLDNEVFLRRPAELKKTLKKNPYADAAENRPNHLLVLFLERKPTTAEIAALNQYKGPERFTCSDRELYLDYVESVGTSKLTPAYLKRQLGQPGTARNWNTLRKLIDAASG